MVNANLLLFKKIGLSIFKYSFFWTVEKNNQKYLSCNFIFQKYDTSSYAI